MTSLDEKKKHKYKTRFFEKVVVMKIGRSLFSFAADEDFRGCFDDDDPYGSLIFPWRFAVVWVVVWVAVEMCASSFAGVRLDGCVPSCSFGGIGVQDRSNIYQNYQQKASVEVSQIAAGLSLVLGVRGIVEQGQVGSSAGVRLDGCVPSCSFGGIGVQDRSNIYQNYQQKASVEVSQIAAGLTGSSLSGDAVP